MIGRKEYKILNPIEVYPNLYRNDGSKTNFVELFLNTLNETDQENWSYFAEDNSKMAKEFLNNGQLSRLIIANMTESNNGQPNEWQKGIAYVQCNLLKTLAPQLMVEDIYSKIGLHSENLHIPLDKLAKNTPLYVNVIAVKKKYQKNTRVLKLILQALNEIIDFLPIKPEKVYAVGVTGLGRKMCQMVYKDGLISEVKRYEGTEKEHLRALYQFDFEMFSYRIKRLAHNTGEIDYTGPEWTDPVYRSIHNSD